MSTFKQQRGWLHVRTRDTSGQITTVNGVKHERCPFCGRAVPLDVTGCPGCAAYRLNETQTNRIVLVWKVILAAAMIGLILACDLIFRTLMAHGLAR